jgi:heme A synthase
MRKTYIAGCVFLQAASIAFGFGGMSGFVQDGGVVDKALVESGTGSNFTGEVGFLIHGIVGGMLIPLAALALLVVSFFVRTPRARTWAAVLFGLILVQAMLGYSIVDVPYLGLVHGANALAVLLTAVHAAQRARAGGGVESAAPSTHVTV